MLSGGERARAMLARALAAKSNLMVLDEPTNDLDLETLDLLQELLSDYEGTALIVSHDRDFLDRVATSVIVSEGNGKWQEYAGGYSDMLSQRGEGVTARKVEKSAPKRAKEEPAPAEKSAKPAGKSKLSFTQQHLLKTLPQTIEAIEAKLAKLQEEMNDPALYTKNPDKFAKLSAQITELTAEKDAAEEQWLELEMLKEEMES